MQEPRVRIKDVLTGGTKRLLTRTQLQERAAEELRNQTVVTKSLGIKNKGKFREGSTTIPPERFADFITNDLGNTPLFITVARHSILLIPRNRRNEVGSVEFWLEEGEGADRFVYNPIADRSRWRATERYRAVVGRGNRQMYSEAGTNVGRVFISSIEIFEPNGMRMEELDRTFSTNFTALRDWLETRGVRLFMNFVQYQGTLRRARHDLSAPICFKHTIIRWIKQDLDVNQYRDFIDNLQMVDAEGDIIEESRRYTFDEKIAYLFNAFEEETTGVFNPHIPRDRESQVYTPIDVESLVALRRVMLEHQTPEELSIEIKREAKEKGHRFYKVYEINARENIKKFNDPTETSREIGNNSYKELITKYYKKLTPELREELKTFLRGKGKILGALEKLVKSDETRTAEERPFIERVKNEIRNIYEREQQGEDIPNIPDPEPEPVTGCVGGSCEIMKHGGIVHGKKDKAVPIIAHEGELVVPKQTVKSVLHSSAWKNHIEQIARSKKITFADAKQYALGNRTIVKKVKPKKKSYWSDTSESDW